MITGSYTLAESTTSSTTLAETSQNGSITATATTTATDTTSVSTSGNDVTGLSTTSQTATSSDTLTKSDSYAGGDADSQTITTAGSTSSSASDNTFTGGFTLSEAGAHAITTQESGTRGGNSFSVSSTEVSTVIASQRSGDSITGAFSATQTLTDSDTLSNIGGAGGGYTITETSNSSTTVSETANTIVGGSTATTYSSDTNSLNQASQNGNASFTLSSSDTTSSTVTEISNSITGGMTSSTSESHSTSLSQSGTNAGGTYAVTATTNESRATISESGNTLTGGYTFTQTATQGYSLNETTTGSTASYTIAESGSRAYTLTQSGSHVTGAYSLTDQGSDGYTLAENGTNSLGGYGQSLTGSDSYSSTEAGNELSGAFSLATIGSGSPNLAESGYLANQPYNSTPADDFTVAESGNYLSGQLSMTEAGTDRYGIMVQFDNTSNTAAANGPGMVDYSPVGAPIRVGGLNTVYSGPGVSGQLNAAATDAAFTELGLGLLHEYCWRAGTCVLVGDDCETPKTATLKRIEDVQRGEFVLCPSDRDPLGPATWKRVEEVYHNDPAAILAIETNSGHVLYPTANHPIFVVEKGWTPAGSLEPGDQFVSHGTGRVRVSAVRDAGLVEPVYNLRVADHHTYFVSDGDPGFSVLAHNESTEAKKEYDDFTKRQAAENGMTPEEFEAANEKVVAEKRDNSGGYESPNWEGTKAGADAYVRGSWNVIKGAAKTLWEAPGAVIDTIGISAEAGSRAAFNSDWKYSPVSSSGHDEGGTFTEKAKNRGKEYVKTVGTLGTAPVYEGYQDYKKTGDPTRMQEAAGGLAGAAVAAKAAPAVRGALSRGGRVNPMGTVGEGVGRAAEMPKEPVPPAAERTPLPPGDAPSTPRGLSPERIAQDAEKARTYPHQNAPRTSPPKVETEVGAPEQAASGQSTPGWVAGRYTRSASTANAYWESGGRVFPTRRNSGLSGEELRIEQQAFFERGLREGKSAGQLRGQAQEAGYERRVPFGGTDHLADRGAEKALQNAIDKVQAEGIEVW